MGKWDGVESEDEEDEEEEEGRRWEGELGGTGKWFR